MVEDDGLNNYICTSRPKPIVLPLDFFLLVYSSLTRLYLEAPGDTVLHSVKLDLFPYPIPDA